MPRQKKPRTVKDLRLRRELTQAEFAQSIGVSTASVSAYETGRVQPSAKVLEKIKEAYQIELPYEKKPRARKAAGRKRKKAAAGKAARRLPEIILQSSAGVNVTAAEVLARIGKADQVYLRADENKAYWVRGEENGSVEIWP